MNREQILSTIKSLAMSQGFYGRLLCAINEDENIMDQLVAQNFKDSLDMILYLECQRYVVNEINFVKALPL